MSWVSRVNAETPLEAVLGQRPELLSRYRTFYRTLWHDGAVPRRVLELTRLRIAAIHDCEAEWAVRDAEVAVGDADLAALRAGDFSGFEAAEQAALQVAELMPYAHHQIEDADVQAIERALGSTGAVGLLTALAFFDVTCRLKLVLGVEARPCAFDDPPLRRGALV